jgi:hypothetical protein
MFNHVMYRTSEQNKPSTSEPASDASESADEGTSTPEIKEIPSKDLEAKIAESKRLAWGGQEPSGISTTARADPPQQPSEKAKESEKPPQKTASDLSIDELEAELARRRNATTSTK